MRRNMHNHVNKFSAVIYISTKMERDISYEKHTTFDYTEVLNLK